MIQEEIIDCTDCKQTYFDCKKCDKTTIKGDIVMTQAEVIDKQAEDVYKTLQSLHRSVRENIMLLEKYEEAVELRESLIQLGRQIGHARGKTWEIQRMLTVEDKSQGIEELTEQFINIKERAEISLVEAKKMTEQVNNITTNEIKEEKKSLIDIIKSFFK